MNRVICLVGLLWGLPALAQPSGILASYPSESYGSALANAANSDPNTVMYCAIDSPDGTSLPNCGTNAVKDAAGWRNGHGVAAQTWAMTGTVPRVTQSALYSQGYESKHAAIGPFSDSNYYNLGASPGTTVLDFAGDFTECLIFSCDGTNTPPRMMLGVGGGGLGYYFGYYPNADDRVTIAFNEPAAAQKIVYGGYPVAGVDNVFCGGRAALKGWAALNALAPVSDDLTGITSAANVPMLGRYNGGTGHSAHGCTIKEFYASTITPTSTLLTAKNNAALSCTHPGACLPDDAGTVMHCYVPSGGGKWLCPINTGGTQWTQNGTVPKVAEARLAWPYGVSKADAEGAGPFSSGNFFYTTTGVIDLTTNFYTCLTFTDSLASAAIPIQTGVDGVSGYYTQIDTTGLVHFYGNATGLLSAAGAVAAGASNIICAGRDTTTLYLKVNGQTTTSTAASITQPPGGTKARLGIYQSQTTYFLPGAIYEVLAVASPPSDALFTRIQRDFMAHTGSFKEPMSVTRTTDATYVVDGAMYRAPANTLRSTPQGKLYEGSYVNTAQYSSQLDQGGAGLWIATTTTVTADQGVAMDGTTTLELVNTTNATAGALIQLGVEGSSTTFTASSQFRADTATKVGTVGVVCNGVLTATAGTCWRSDGGACTAGLALANNACIAYGTFDTTRAVRMSIGCTCSVATTGASILIAGGQYGAATGQIYAGAAQLEMGLFPHQYCGATLNATKTCNADVVTVWNSLAPFITNWCIRVGDWTPENGRAWGKPVASMPVSSGTFGAANSLAIYELGGNIIGVARDAANNDSTITYAHGYAAGSRHSLIFCMNGATPTLFSDGAAVGVASGAGTGRPAPWSTTLTLSTATYPVDGYVGRIDINSSGSPLDFP